MPRVRHIPIFIPHLGCSHQCVFCNQRTISGNDRVHLEDVSAQIEGALRTIRRDEVDRLEIAYFGGSFTAIPQTVMLHLLSLAQRYVESGAVDGIRFSTRPDAVSEQTLDLLSAYTISAIELGLQSLDDAVLAASERGHTAAVAEDACRRIVARGYRLGGQMMLGLPQSTPDSERYTARKIVALGAAEARIYPTVVLKDTPLALATERGEYRPLTVEEAVVRAARVLRILEEAGISCLRIGLCENEGLRSGSVLGGAHHPALGELVRSRLYLERMQELLDEEPLPTQGSIAVFSVAPGAISQAIGQHRSNLHQLSQLYGLARICVQPSDQLSSGEILLSELIPQSHTIK